MTRKQKKLLLRIIIAAALVVILQFLPAEGWLRFGLYLIPYLIVGYDILRRAALGIFHGQVFDENFLMAVATVGAFALALGKTGDYLEAVAVMAFYQLGELFQSYAVGKSRRNIASLMDIRPDYANVMEDGVLVRVDPEELPVGTEIYVQPGEKVPIDGIVLEGSSLLNTAALTGESLPRTAEAGSEVISGCVNETGLLKLRTTRVFGESTVSKILELVENAGNRKARPEQFISKFARFYTPAVCIAALLLALCPPLINLLLGQSPMWSQWVYRALSFLVISCPCALVISIPLSFFAAIGGAGRQGILIKGSNYLEVLSRVRTVVMDKTGTLTCGEFTVSGIEAQGLTQEQLLEYAALAESASSHPLGKGILRAYGKQPDRSRIRELEELRGRGVRAKIDGHPVLAGNLRLLEEFGIVPSVQREETTAVYLAIDGQYRGKLLLTDTLKPTAKDAMKQLQTAGIKRLVMLTGDNPEAARQVAARLGIREYHHSLLPENKVILTEELLQQSKDKLCFVGDGINDAPVLSRADVGVAMGALGSDAAIEAADVVLMDDDPRKLATALRLSRKCMRIVKQNIVFSLAVKFLCLIVGALGLAGLWLAIFADVGVMVIAILNAIRALWSK